MNLKDKFTNIVKNVFDSPDQNEYNFVLSSPYENQSNSRTPEEIEKNEKIFEAENIFSSLSVNLEYVKVKYNTLINSDIVVREFTLTARNRQYSAFLLFIDGKESIRIGRNVDISELESKIERYYKIILKGL